jgi:hypothetical protein
MEEGQGYDDKEDERLGMKKGPIAGKDLDSEKARRDDAGFETRVSEMSEEENEDYDDMLLAIGDMMSNRRDQMVDRETINLDDYDETEVNSLKDLRDMVPNGLWFDMDGDGILDPEEIFNIFKEKYGQPKVHIRRTMGEEEMEGEAVEGMMRSHAAGQDASSDKSKGLPKPHSVPNKLRLGESAQKEIQQLREKNEEYRKALNIFKEKLNEVAVFNSNLAYATRLFTENTTTKQEKINILRRFDSVETLKESKSLYKTLKEEFDGKEANTISELVSEKVSKTPVKGSSANLIENKTYENPQFMRMKDLMTKIIK